MGSGTTLLRLVLDSHPRIAIPQETGFMRAARAHRFIPFKWSGRRWYRRLGWSDEEFNALQRDFYDTVFRRYAEQHGKVRWGDKTPLHTWHVDQMTRLFPDAVFVGVVRHPAGSVASNRSRWRHDIDTTVYHYWRYTTEVARQAIKRRRRFRVVRYEDLVSQPEPLLRELLRWLGEPWSDEVLRHGAVQRERGGKVQVEGRVRVDDPVDPSRVSKWTEVLDEREVARVRAELAPLGRLFGYSMDDPLALAPVRPDGRLLIRGRDLADRAASIPGLDVQTRPPVPKFERLYHPGELTLEPAEPDGESRVPDWMQRALTPVVQRLPAGARRRARAASRLPGGDGDANGDE
jgi:hypothetical protein